MLSTAQNECRRLKFIEQHFWKDYGETLGLDLTDEQFKKAHHKSAKKM